jgi:phosphatidylinositol alpha-1,6-mannosyltransferase
VGSQPRFSASERPQRSETPAKVEVKILYLTPGCFDKGGISRYSRYQIRGLRELVGDENVSIHSLLGPGTDDFEEDLRVDNYARGAGTVNKLSFISSFYSWALINRPKAIFSAHVNLSGAAKALSLLTGAKTFLNVYGLEVWSGMSRDAAWGLRSTDQVISDCHHTARYLEDRGFRAKGSTVVAWDCVDLDRFFPNAANRTVLAKYGIPDPLTGINLLTLGRISGDAAYKGYERLLDAFRFVAPQQTNLRLIYAGRGDLVEELRKKAKTFGLSDRVFFTGSVHEDDLPDVYRSAHIFSLVSDSGRGKGEGIPLTPLEAAACGIPIIVSDQDGSQEAVIENSNGFVLDPFDKEGLVGVLLLLARDLDLREQMGKAARLRIEKEFGFPNFVEKHRELLVGSFPDFRAFQPGERSVKVSEGVAS